jgi:two-component sensor histidine kinase
MRHGDQERRAARFIGESMLSAGGLDAAPWVSRHTDGSRIEPHDYAAARALRGERVVAGMELLYVCDEGECWTRVSAVPVPAAGGSVVAAVVLVEDVDAWKRSDRQRELLLTELNHRVKNILATVQGLAAQTL